MAIAHIRNIYVRRLVIIIVIPPLTIVAMIAAAFAAILQTFAEVYNSVQEIWRD